MVDDLVWDELLRHVEVLRLEFMISWHKVGIGLILYITFLFLILRREPINIQRMLTSYHLIND